MITTWPDGELLLSLRVPSSRTCPIAAERELPSLSALALLSNEKDPVVSWLDIESETDLLGEDVALDEWLPPGDAAGFASLMWPWILFHDGTLLRNVSDTSSTRAFCRKFNVDA